MIAYKLLDQELKSNDGTFQWEIGKTYTIDKPGNKMCSDEVFHCYNHPALAVLFNRIHADIQNPRLFEIEVPEFVNNDQLKYASKSQKLIKEIDLPVISINQRIEFAIKVAKIVCKDEAWNAWADKWLSGEDRTEESAYDVASDVSDLVAYFASASVCHCSSYYAVCDYVARAARDAAYAGATNEEFIRIIEEIIDKES